MNVCRLRTLLVIGVLACAGMLLHACAQPEARTDCDMDRGACAKELPGGTTVSLDIFPKPVLTMSERLCRVTLRQGGLAVPTHGVKLDLSMPGMTMARNTLLLESRGNGVYEGKCVFVRCSSGRKVWRASVDAEHPGMKGSHAEFTFRVAK